MSIDIALREELVGIVKDFASNSPRSRQKTIGVSEIGHPCARRIAYKVLGVEPTNTDSDPWPAIVGTATHAYLEKVFKKHEDFLTEIKVKLQPWTKGTADLVHLAGRKVIDHKVVGTTALRKAKAEGMSEQYRIQLNTYATGLRIAGYEIEQISVMFWPRNGQLREALAVTEDYDEGIVDKTLERFDAIKAATRAGTQVLPLIPTTPTHCDWCPYFFPLSNDAAESCNGDHTVDTTQPS